jgi:hypothetical protein
METNAPMTDRYAPDVFYREWNHLLHEACLSVCRDDCADCLPAPWVLDRILDLLAQEPFRSIDELLPAIEKVLRESRFVTSGGEFPTGHNGLPTVEKQAGLIVKTLKRIKAARSCCPQP